MFNGCERAIWPRDQFIQCTKMVSEEDLVKKALEAAANRCRRANSGSPMDVHDTQPDEEDPKTRPLRICSVYIHLHVCWP